MRTSLRFVLFAAAWLAFLVPTLAAGPTFPPLTGRVVDDANILSDETRAKLVSMSEQEEKQTGNQIVVATIKSLQGYPIEQYGYQLGRHWGIGQKGKDNGALIIIAPSEHRVRIEVGYGLEGQLTDAQTSLIIAEVMTPAFKRGDYDSGVLAGMDAVLKTIGGAAITPDKDYSGDEIQARHNNPIGAGIIPIIVLVILFWIGGWRFMAGLLLGNVLSGGGRGGGFGGGWGGGGGFGGGGGGFSGGGGSFGGGGASGSW